TIMGVMQRDYTNGLTKDKNSKIKVFARNAYGYKKLWKAYFSCTLKAAGFFTNSAAYNLFFIFCKLSYPNI
ncbi:MAG: hypothetical protein RR292_02130, partial [Christensenellaceae bacterium]